MKRAILLMMACLSLSCGLSVSLTEDINDYQEEVQRLQRQIELDPNDAEALRELGAIHVRTRFFREGIDYLERAQDAASGDQKTLFYLGLAYESVFDYDKALAAYQQYTGLPSGADYRPLMESGFQRVSREKVREEMRARIDVEQSLIPGNPNTVGVFTLTYQGDDARYEPLGRGLSELLSIDLAKVEQLTVVERQRLQAVVDELQLVERGLIDPGTAPRVGRLLGAGTILGGTVNVSGRENVQMDVISLDVVSDRDLPDAQESDVLDNLFRLEKAMAFRLIEETLEIQLTPEERAAIDTPPPTQNLQAFLAYSRGLQQEDAGDFSGAARSFQQAASFDANFREAATRGQRAQNLHTGGRDRRGAMGAVRRLDPPPPPVRPGFDLRGTRLQNLGNNVGSNFVPGQDRRRGAEEERTSELPLPPPPPPSGNN